MGIVLLVILLLLCLGGIPWGGYHSYGYGPSGVVGILVVVLLVLLVTGRL